VFKNIQEGKKITDAQIQPGINRKVKTVYMNKTQRPTGNF
jgi:hypothetical protein